MIPMEAVDAAAKAYRETRFVDDALMNALEAATPYIRAAALEGAADAMTREQPGHGPWGVPQHEHQAQWLRDQASVMRCAS